MNSLVKKILKMEDTISKLKDEEFPKKTDEFKKRIKNGEKLDAVLPEAFALVREATNRMLGIKHYPVQLLGGIELHRGKIAELKTGEGKTIVALPPSYLNALEGKGAHVVTVNDYLAKRDAQWMKPVYDLLGMTIGYITSETSALERQNAYKCDITYVTNNELGFDFLRDHLVMYPEQQVQRGFHYAIVDEADSVFIDEARTPLIIAEPQNDSLKLQKMSDNFVKSLTKSSRKKEIEAKDILIGEIPNLDGDYVLDEKTKMITLTENGIIKAEKYFNIRLNQPQNAVYLHHIELALRANYIMHKNIDYIVRNGKINIVDEFTGRAAEDRRFSNGLHQAIEAKENVEIKQDTETVASVTYQSLFHKYKKLSGMTGTIETEKKEIKEIYGLKVSVIPTNVPIRRKDLPDKIYALKKDKYNAIIHEILSAHAKGQPVLVGTSSVHTSEELSSILKKKKIVHQVLNAKHHEQEAEIISHAGEAGAVTIATNMAGRGTDIKLTKESLKAGGLYVIGAEKHEARRIDNQLRGRSGRQGDPGKTQFYISLQDKLLKPFIPEKFIQTYSNSINDGEEIKDRNVITIIRNAQKKKETENFGIRKNVFDYDQVNHKQMEVLYAERNQILHKELKKDFIKRLAKEFKANIDIESLDSFQKHELLQIIDRAWVNHLAALDASKRYASLQSLGQVHPVIEYKLQAYELFKEMIVSIKGEYVKLLTI